MALWTACPCPSLCCPAKFTNPKLIRSLRKPVAKRMPVLLETTAPRETLSASLKPLFNTATLHPVWSSGLIRLCFRDSLWNRAVCQPPTRRSRSRKPSTTLSSHRQGIPWSGTTHMSVVATVPKYLWFMLGVHFFGVNCNWIFLFFFFS